MEFLVKPWAHQLEAIEKAKNLNSFGLFFEQGTGKTGACINILRYKFGTQGRLLRTIVFGPPIVVENWRDEWALHSKIPRGQIIPLVGSGEKRLKTFMKNAYDEGHSFSAGEVLPRIFLTNYESLLMKPLFSAMKAWEPEALVFDECHRLKNWKAQRSKLAAELSNPVGKTRPLVYGLSGTSILNSLLDIFQQFVIIDGGRTFGQNFLAFRGLYFRDRNAGMPKERYFPKWEPRTLQLDNFDAEKEIGKKLSERSMRVEKKDCLDLPPELNQIIKVGMTPEQTRLYKEMKSEFITFLGDKACTATIALTKALRLMQISSGFVAVKSENGGLSDNGDSEGEASVEAVRLKNTPKQAALKSLLEDLTPEHKVLVWAVWKENYLQIKEVLDELGVCYVEVHGGISAAKKQANIERFKTSPDCRVFLGHPGSGGIGINLVVAPYSIFYSRTFSLEHYLQARARNHRGGSEIHEKITHYDLVCENTIDELVVKRLSQKIQISEKVFGSFLNDLKDQSDE